MATSVITVAEDAFELLVTRPAPLVFDARGLSGTGIPAGMVPLDELRDLLVRRVVNGPAVDVVWRRLVFQAREWGPEWVVGAVGVAAPGLRRLAARLSTGRAHLVEDIESEVVAGFLAALRGASSVDLDAPRLWLQLMWAAWRAGHRVTQVPEFAELPPELVAGSSTPHVGYGHPDLLLGRAAVLGVISAQDAELIGETRLGGVLVEALAGEYGVSPAALRMRRSRAERRLLRALRRGELSDVVLGAVPARDWAVQARRDGFTGSPAREDSRSPCAGSQVPHTATSRAVGSGCQGRSDAVRGTGVRSA
jgi:hypothetical protein